MAKKSLTKSPFFYIALLSVCLELIVGYIGLNRVTLFFNGPVSFVSRAVVEAPPADTQLTSGGTSFGRGDLPPADRTALRRELLPRIKGRSAWRKAILATDWVRHQPTRLGGSGIYGSPAAVLSAVRQGVPAICSDLAKLNVSALRAVGLSARYISLFRNPPFDKYASHATTEVWIGKKWVLVSPSFGVYYTIAGRPLSAAEIQRNWRLPLEKQKKIAVHKLDNHKVGVDLRKYYTNPFSLFENIVYHAPRPAKGGAAWYLSHTLPFEYFYRELYSIDRPSTSPFIINNMMHLFLALINPFIFIVCLAGIAVTVEVRAPRWCPACQRLVQFLYRPVFKKATF